MFHRLLATVFFIIVITIGFSANVLSISSMTDDGAGNVSFDLSYDFQDDVAGFQIDILSDNTFILNDAYGGDVENAGFLISTNESGRMIGFSLTGAVIAAGQGDFVSISGTYDESLSGSEINLLAFEDCISDGDPICDSDDTRMLLSNSDGTTLDSSFNPSCWTVGNNILTSGACTGTIDDCGVPGGNNSSCTGCMIADATNYNPDATIECEDCCEFPEIYITTVTQVGFIRVLWGEEFNQNTNSRELLSYDLYRDGQLIQTFDSIISSYEDYLTEPEIEYCYIITANYADFTINSDESCDERFPFAGCTDTYADNFDPEAEDDDGSCEYSVAPVYGTVFLENQTNHSGINIEFFPISGSAQLDTVQTDDNGTYFVVLSPGMYTINIFMDGYIPITMPGEFALFENTQLETFTLIEGIVQEVSGTLNGNQRWTSNYQYRIIDNTFVSNGDTLIIDPGVEIKFMNDFLLEINGVLQANGTEQDSILFTSGRPVKNAGDWNKIILTNNDSYINYTILEYGHDALEAYTNTMMINSSTFRHNSGYGIVAESGNIFINECDIYDNNQAIYAYINGQISVINNQIFDNYEVGIRLRNFRNVNIEGNYFYNNLESDIYFSSNTSSTNQMEYFIINQNVFMKNNNQNNYQNITINCGGNCDGELPFDNEFHIMNNQITNYTGGGIYINNLSNAILNIKNNTINSSIGPGLDISNSNLGNIERNYIATQSNAQSMSYGVILENVENINVRNNNVKSAYYSSIYVDNSPQASIYNNIIWDDEEIETYTGVSVGIEVIGATPYVGYNCFWNSNFNITDDFPIGFGEIITTNINGTPADTWYNIFQNPELTDIAGENFTPIDGSIVIDAGRTDSFDPDESIADIGMIYFDQGTVEPMIISIAANQTYGTYPLFVQFNANIEGPANTYNWSFGNGETSNNSQPVISYANAGTYDVSLTVEGPGGTDTFISENLITVVEPTLPPAANLMADITTGLIPLEVQFSNLTLNDADSYLWDFGDGNTSQAFEPSHTYESEGVYTVSLTAYGPYGENTIIMDSYINALEPEAIIASYNINETVGVAPFTVYFENTTIGTVDSYLWDFGDGNTSTTTNPMYTFNDYGLFDVTLTAIGPVNEDSISQTISVFLPTPIITEISDVPNDQGGRIYLTFIRSGHDTDQLNRFESYQVERLDDMGWIGVNNYNAYGTDTYHIEVPTLIDSTETNNAITNYRVIASMDEGLFASNEAEGYSVDNLPPAVPDQLFASIVDDEINIGWNYTQDDDFAYHKVNTLWGSPMVTISNNMTTNMFTLYDEYDVNSVDVHGNESESTEDKVAGYQLHQGANLVSFSVLHDNQSIDNVINIPGITSVISEGTAANYNDILGWIGSISEIKTCNGYWLISNDENLLVTVGPKEQCEGYNIHYGANLISYTCSSETSLSSLENILIENDINIIIGEGVAATYNPVLGFIGSLEFLSPGRGYWFISGSDDIELSIDCSDLDGERLNREQITPVNGYHQSTKQSFYFFENIDGVENGDIIRAYHQDTLIGGRVWTGSYTDIPAMGADIQNQTSNYANEESMIRFTIQKPNQTEQGLTGNFPLWSNNKVFIINDAMIATEIPDNYSISNIYPNPFNPSVTIDYSIPEMSLVNISIYDLKGVKVAELINDNIESGYHSISWNGSNHASGVYIVQIQANGFNDTQKIMLLK